MHKHAFAGRNTQQICVQTVTPGELGKHRQVKAQGVVGNLLVSNPLKGCGAQKNKFSSSFIVSQLLCDLLCVQVGGIQLP